VKKTWRWILPLLITGCEPEVIYIDKIHEINDTLYVQIHDTSYVQKEAAFGLATHASIYPVGTDSIALDYWYALTKMDTSAVDSVFLFGYLLEWDNAWGLGTVMNKTLHVPWPHNARDWNEIYSYSQGAFSANRKFAREEWPENGMVTYTFELEYN
tara:strand:+ start:204 stop:671 length:468 start_codon:yes stop_codon:yes gene_type:complete